MFQKEVKIIAEQGLHTRPASQFAKAAKGYEAEVLVTANGKSAKATSLLKLQTLGLVQGTMITISAEGNDAEKAVEELSALVAELE